MDMIALNDYYLTPHLVEGVPTEEVWATMQHLAQPAAEGFVAMMGEGVKLSGAHARYESGCSTYIVVNRWNQSTCNNPAMQDYIGCQLRWMVHHAIRRRTSIARLGERAATINLLVAGYYGVARCGPHCTRPRPRWTSTNNCGTQVRLYSPIFAVRTAKLFFFLCADGKAQNLMANCKDWKAEAPQAMVCWVCGYNRAQCLANFGLEDTIDRWWDVVLAIGAIYRHIAADRRIPDYGLHGVLCVTICARSGMRDAVVATMGKSAAVVVRNLFQPILDVALIQAKMVTKGRLNNDKANGKRKG